MSERRRDRKHLRKNVMLFTYYLRLFHDNTYTYHTIFSILFQYIILMMIKREEVYGRFINDR